MAHWLPDSPLVFTDLDGTLLDTATYEWQPATQALQALERAAGLLIPCTSKTWAEVQPVQESIGIDGPAIVENGGAIHGRDDPRPEAAVDDDGGWQLALGPARQQILEGLAEMGVRLGDPLQPFSELADDAATRLTGLSLTDLRAARERHHSEPFLAPRNDLRDLQQAATDLGLRVTMGGRFFHLGGEADKGAAMRLLLGGYAEAGWHGASIGLGDSLNDLPLILEVDHAVVIPKPDGRCDAELRQARDDVILAPAPGPQGWNDAVLDLLHRLRTGA